MREQADQEQKVAVRTAQRAAHHEFLGQIEAACMALDRALHVSKAAYADVARDGGVVVRVSGGGPVDAECSELFALLVGQLHAEVSTRAHARHRPPRHPADMTNSSVAAERWHPWSHPTPRGADLALAISLFLLATAWLVLDWVFGLGMDVWAAHGDQSQIDVAGLAHIGRTQVLLVVVLTAAVLAGIYRAWRTVVAQVLAALLAGGVLMAAQHQWDTSHTSPGCIRYAAHC